MTSLVHRLWYGKGRPLAFLAPLAWLFRTVAEVRRRKAWEALAQPLPVPVVGPCSAYAGVAPGG